MIQPVSSPSSSQLLRSWYIININSTGQPGQSIPSAEPVDPGKDWLCGSNCQDPAAQEECVSKMKIVGLGE